jgi:uncharacterized protein
MKEVSVDGKPFEDTVYASDDILIDTNILVFAHHEGSQYHTQASCILLASLQGSLKAHVSNQNLLEFFSVMTSSGKVKPTPDTDKVSRICSDLLSSHNIAKIYASQNALEETIEMARRRKLHGPRIFDCFLAVTAKENKIDRIWTDNVSDLKLFEDSITVENPLTKTWSFENEEPPDL